MDAGLSVLTEVGGDWAMMTRGWGIRLPMKTEKKRGKISSGL
jgi:hypothetical protein